MSAWTDAFVAYGPGGAGRKAPVGSLTDKSLLQRLERYKRQVAKRYRVIDAQQIEAMLPKGRLWISPKLDGELWFLVRAGGDLALCSHNGRVVMGIPALAGAAKRLAAAPDAIIAGELVARIAEGRARVHHVATALADDALAGKLTFHPFDLVEEAGVDALGRPYAERLGRLTTWFGDDAGCPPITTVEGEAGVAATHYREWVAAGRHEGLVVRTEQGVTYKIKPHFTIDAVIVGFGERLTGETRQIRELSVALVRDDASLQILGTVGSGFSEEDRVAWHRRLSATLAPSSFRMANSDGTLSHFVRPEIAIEIRCSDLLATDGSDESIRRMSLRWDASAGYTTIGETPTAVMLHPTFLRERTDKAASIADCGMTQVTSRIVLEEHAGPLRQGSGAATLVKRMVWTKDVKGELAVRKFVLLKNDHGHGREYAPWTVFFTDFSPGRADPLQTTLRTASTQQAAEAIIEAWKLDNVKKGWNEAGAAGAGAPASSAAAASLPPEGSSTPAARKPRAKKGGD
jgi:hypothetical protein